MQPRVQRSVCWTANLIISKINSQQLAAYHPKFWCRIVILGGLEPIQHIVGILCARLLDQSLIQLRGGLSVRCLMLQLHRIHRQYCKYGHDAQPLSGWACIAAFVPVRILSNGTDHHLTPEPVTPRNIVAAMEDEEPVARVIDDFEVRPLASDVVLATYLCHHTSPSGLAHSSRRSSIWREGPDGWQMVFHQGTRLPSQ